MSVSIFAKPALPSQRTTLLTLVLIPTFTFAGLTELVAKLWVA